MEIMINGDARTVKDDIRLGELLDALGLREKVMAAAVNMEVIKKEQWDTYELHNEDRVELLDFVGGG